MASGLPAPIIRRIFDHCIPTGNVRHLPCLGVDAVPLVLGQICSSWRTSALSLPHLWSALKVVFPYHKRVDAVKYLILLWLHRSGSSPLLLHISAYLNPRKSPNRDLAIPLPDLESLKEIFNDLAVHSSRWQDVRFEFSTIAFRHVIYAAKNTPIYLKVPKLESFYLAVGGGDHYPSEDQRHAVKFQLASALSLWSISVISVDFSVELTPVPWTRLISLTVIGIKLSLPTTEWLQLLSTMGSLRQCFLCIAPPNPRTSTQGRWETEVSLPSLQSLHLRIFGENPAGFWRRIACPNLKDITVEYSSDSRAAPTPRQKTEPLWSQDIFAVFVNHTTALEELHLWSVPITEFQLIQILDLVPSISTLTLRSNEGLHQPIGDIFLKSLLPTRETIRIPQLKFLAIDSDRVSDGQLLEFLEARWHPIYSITRIRRISLRHFPLFPDNTELVKCLRRYQKEGLLLEFRN